MQLDSVRSGAMLGSDYKNQTCSVAAALEVVGERWSLLIVRDVLLGFRRFDQLQADLGVARNILQSRLSSLVEAGVLEKRRYQERPERFEYRLTEKGLDLWPTIVALLQWGDKYEAPNGPPVVLVHRGCGGEVDEHRMCTACGSRLEVRDVRPRRGPGVRPDVAWPALREGAEPLSAGRAS
jgi:DNA-binding HxlR family transcriptional regulator